MIRLLKARKNHSAEATKQILVKELVVLRRFAYSLTRDMNDADDLVQIVIEKILRKGLPKDVEPTPWIMRVCKNAWIDEVRSRKVKQTDHDKDTDQLPDPNASQPAENELQKEELAKALDSLDEPFRVVVGLVIVSGLSYKEASQVLDVPIGTIMSRIARARAQLAKQLQHLNEA